MRAEYNVKVTKKNDLKSNKFCLFFPIENVHVLSQNVLYQFQFQ